MTSSTEPPEKRWRDLDSGQFNATITTAAERLNVQPLAVEKDYWVCQALRAITIAYPDNIVFKGGTSLEKLRIIQRFSEDLDLLVTGNLGGVGATKTAMRKMVAAAAASTGKAPEEAGSGGKAGSLHRAAYLKPPLVNDPEGGMADAAAVLVELGQSGGPHPSKSHHIESLLARALTDTDLNVEEWDDLRPFPVTILHPGRTLIEKLLRVNNFALRADEQAGRHGWPRIGRQFYDIWALLGREEVQTLLSDKDLVASILHSVAEVSQAFTPDEPVPAGGFATCAAFATDGPLAERLKREHDDAMTNLYYGDENTAPSFEDVIARIDQHRLLLDPDAPSRSASHLRRPPKSIA